MNLSCEYAAPPFTHCSRLNNIALAAERLRQKESICWREKQYDSFLPGEQWLEKTMRKRQEGREQTGALEGTWKHHNHKSQGSVGRSRRDICIVVYVRRSENHWNVISAFGLKVRSTNENSDLRVICAILSRPKHCFNLSDSGGKKDIL